MTIFTKPASLTVAIIVIVVLSFLILMSKYQNWGSGRGGLSRGFAIGSSGGGNSGDGDGGSSSIPLGKSYLSDQERDHMVQDIQLQLSTIPSDANSAYHLSKISEIITKINILFTFCTSDSLWSQYNVDFHARKIDLDRKQTRLIQLLSVPGSMMMGSGGGGALSSTSLASL